jgi:hypothetical protein
MPYAVADTIRMDMLTMITSYLIIFSISACFIYKNRSALKSALFLCVFAAAWNLAVLIGAARQRESIVFSMNENIIVADVKGAEARIFSFKKLQDRELFYLSEYMGMKHIVRQTIVSGSSILQCGDKKMMILNDYAQLRNKKEKFSTDILISDLKNIKPDRLLSGIDFKTLIITAKLRPDKHKEIAASCNMLGKVFHATAVDGAYIYE